MPIICSTLYHKEFSGGGNLDKRKQMRLKKKTTNITVFLTSQSFVREMKQIQTSIYKINVCA